MRRYLCSCLLALSLPTGFAGAADAPSASTSPSASAPSASAPSNATPSTGSPTADTGFVNFDDEHRYSPLLNAAEIHGKLIDMVDNGKPFRAIYQPDLSGTPKGALLILQHFQDEPGELALFDVLRQTLAERGWASLTVPMPIMPAAAQSPATSPAANLAGASAKDKADADPALATQRARVTGRLQIAQEYLIQQGLMNMAVLASGDHNLYARWLMEKSGGNGKGKLQPLQGWVLLDAENPQTNSNANLLSGMEKLTTPALDITTTEEHRPAQQTRQQFAREHQWQKWQSVSYPATPASSTSSAARISNRIYGWLEKNVAGKSMQANVIRQ